MKTPAVLRVLSPEILENRVAPAAVFALTDDNLLLRFDSTTPGTIDSSLPITGLPAGETIVGIDFRPADLSLYALGSTGALYALDPATAKATSLTATPFNVNGTDFGFDFNPTVDRVRVVSDLDQNLRLNPNTGAPSATDATLNYVAGDPNAGANPNVVASAYTNNFAGATTTTLYGLDTSLRILVTQNPPNNGTLNTVGSLGINATSAAAFDIFTGAFNTGYAALSTDGASSALYIINLTTGAASMVGTIGGGHLVTGLAMAPTSFSAVLTGNVVSFFGTPFDDSLTIDSAGGLLRHNRFTAGDDRFNSDFDFNSALAGDQTLSASAGAAGLLISGGAGRDTIKIVAPDTTTIVDIRAPSDIITGAKGFLTKNSLTFPDADGDAAKLTVSKGPLSFFNFQFAAGDQGVSGLQLQTLLFNNLQFSAANVTLTAKRTADGGNNSAAIGFISATSIDLGAVKLAGDLGRVIAGDSANPLPALKSLSVHSIGLYGATTQAPGGNLVSFITGSVGSIVVRSSVLEANITLIGDATVQIGKISIGGSLIGLSSVNAGQIASPGNIGSVSLGGSLVGSATASGAITANGDIGTVKLRGSMVGDALTSGSIYSYGGSIRSVTVGGDLIAGSSSSGIFAGRQLGTVSIGGSVFSVGGGTAAITAQGIAPSAELTAAQTVAIKSVKIRGSAHNLFVLAGYDFFAPINPDVQIGSVSVGGDWAGGSIVAGVDDGGNGFGNTLDAAIASGNPALPSRIASIIIKGQALGFTGGASHFGFVAEHVVSVKVGGVAIPLQPNPNNDILGLAIGITDNLRVREI